MKKPKVLESTFSTYTPTEILGQGGSGVVYQVIDDSGEVYAAKVLDPSKATQEKMKRFRNELHFGLTHKHSHTIAILDHGNYWQGKTKTPFYVMKCYAGSLRSLMNAGITPEAALSHFSQLLDGVEAAHLHRVIHRDLKPENVLYDGSTRNLVVGDFGVAHFHEEDLYTTVETAPGDRLANFLYAAPEQRNRKKSVDHRADIFALGLILNEMFTKEVPQGTGYKSIASVSEKDAYLDVLVSEMIRQDPSSRPESVDAVKKRLIAQKQDFVTRQKLSELKKVVVPVTDLDDPLLVDPPSLVNIDWEKGVLRLFLNRAVNDKWVHALRNMPGRTALMMKGPERFQFSGKEAVIDAQEHEVQPIVNYFKQWLPMATQTYERTLKQENHRAEERERERLQQEIKEEERRQRILKNVKL